MTVNAFPPLDNKFGIERLQGLRPVIDRHLTLESADLIITQYSRLAAITGMNSPALDIDIIGIFGGSALEPVYDI